MTDVASAEAAATTNWRSYDGNVLPGFKFHVIFFPALLGLSLVLPVMLCYCCLSRSRIVPYTPPNYMGGDLSRFPTSASSMSAGCCCFGVTWG